MPITAFVNNPPPKTASRLHGWFTSAWQLSFTDTRYRILLHTTFWAFLLFFWLKENLVVRINASQPYAITLTGIALSLFLFYPLVYGIVPLCQRRKWLPAAGCFVLYYLLAVLLRTYHISQLIANYKGDGWFAGQDFWDKLYQHHLRPLNLLAGFFSSITGLLTIIYIPLTIKFIRYAYRTHWQQNELEKEKVQLELNFLKAQVNPHLLFNSLNNLQSYIVHDEKERSVELLNRLAALLRYSLYENTGEWVKVEQEAALLQHYIAVEQVRYDEHSTISVDIEPGALTYPLPALLLLPLVENAFKYSASLPAAAISIQLITREDVLTFVSRNGYDASGIRHRGGIGLTNVHKRLQHYFPGRHRLHIDDTGSTFTLTLTLYPQDHEMFNR